MGDYEPVDTGCRRAAVAKEGPALGVGPSFFATGGIQSSQSQTLHKSQSL